MNYKYFLSFVLLLAGCTSTKAPPSLVSLEQMGATSEVRSSSCWPYENAALGCVLKHRSVVNMSAFGANNFVGLMSAAPDNTLLPDAHTVQIVTDRNSRIQELILETNASVEKVNAIAEKIKKLNQLVLERSMKRIQILVAEVKKDDNSGVSLQADSAQSQQNKEIEEKIEDISKEVTKYNNLFITRWSNAEADKSDATLGADKATQSSAGYYSANQEKLSGIAVLAGIRKTRMILGEDFICEGMKADKTSSFSKPKIEKYLPVQESQAKYISFIEDLDTESALKAYLNVYASDIAGNAQLAQLAQKLKAEVSYYQNRLLSVGLRGNISGALYKEYAYSFKPKEREKADIEEMNRSNGYVGFYSAQVKLDPSPGLFRLIAPELKTSCGSE